MTEQRIGRYRILKEIGSGGQAVVYSGVDPDTDEVVAIKVLKPGSASDAGLVTRFLREARITAAIEHQNIIRILDVGEHDGDTYCAMEYVPDSLADILKREGQLPIERAAEVTAAIADGIAVAHDVGIVHRDIKPQNILVTDDGIPKVTDFGIARAEALTTMTATGVIMGTPHYMSPEQGQGERVDARSDIYSLGILLYHALAGRVPFESQTPVAVLHAQIYEDPTPVSELRPDTPEALADVVMKAMEKNRENRFQTADDMAIAIRAALSPDSKVKRPSRPARAERVDSEASSRSRGGGLIGALTGRAMLWIPVLVAGGAAAGIAAFLFMSGFTEESISETPDFEATMTAGVVEDEPVAAAIPEEEADTPVIEPVAVEAAVTEEETWDPQDPVSRSYPAEDVSGTKVARFSEQERSGTGVSEIAILFPDVEESEMTLTVSPTSDRGPPGASVFKVLDIDLSGVRSPETTMGGISFQVPDSWLEEQEASVNDVRLFHGHEGWEELETIYLQTAKDAVTGENVHRFTATTPGFSLFAIALAVEEEEVDASDEVVEEVEEVEIDVPPTPTPVAQEDETIAEIAVSKKIIRATGEYVSPGITSGTVKVPESRYFDIGSGVLFWSVRTSRQGYFYAGSHYADSPPVHIANVTGQGTACNYTSTSGDIQFYHGYEGVEDLGELTDISDFTYGSHPDVRTVGFCSRDAASHYGIEDTVDLSAGMIVFKQGVRYGVLDFVSMNDDHVLTVKYWLGDPGVTNFSHVILPSSTPTPKPTPVRVIVSDRVVARDSTLKVRPVPVPTPTPTPLPTPTPIPTPTPTQVPPTPTPTPVPTSTPIPPPTPTPTVTPVPVTITVDAGAAVSGVVDADVCLSGAWGKSSLAGDLLAASVDWGDGSGYTGALLIQDTGEIEACNKYRFGGSYFVTIRVVNDSGVSTEASFYGSILGGSAVPTATPTPVPTATPIPSTPVPGATSTPTPTPTTTCGYGSAAPCQLWLTTWDAQMVSSRPTIANGQLFMGHGNHVDSVNAWTGELSVTGGSTGDVIRSKPFVKDGLVYVSSVDGSVHALDAAELAVHWSTDLELVDQWWGDAEIYSSPLVQGGAVYVGATNGKVYALRESDGSLLWSTQTSADVSIKYASPVADTSGRLYVAAGGGISALREGDGSKLWRQTSYLSGAQSSNVTLSLEQLPGALYVGSLGNALVKLNLDTGSVIWQVPLFPDIYSTPVIYGGKVYITVGDTLYTIFADDGTIEWQYDAYTGVLGSPAISNGVMYVASSSGFLDAVNLSNGSRIWRYELSIMPYAGLENPNTPVFHDGGSAIYISGEDANGNHGTEAVYLGGS